MICPFLKLQKMPYFTTLLLVVSHRTTFSKKRQQHCLRSANISRIHTYCSLLSWSNFPLDVIECSLLCSFCHCHGQGNKVKATRVMVDTWRTIGIEQVHSSSGESYLYTLLYSKKYFPTGSRPSIRHPVNAFITQLDISINPSQIE